MMAAILEICIELLSNRGTDWLESRKYQGDKQIKNS